MRSYKIHIVNICTYTNKNKRNVVLSFILQVRIFIYLALFAMDYSLPLFIYTMHSYWGHILDSVMVSDLPEEWSRGFKNYHFRFRVGALTYMCAARTRGFFALWFLWRKPEALFCRWRLCQSRGRDQSS